MLAYSVRRKSPGTCTNIEPEPLLRANLHQSESQRRDLASVERKIGNLLDALADGIRTTNVQKRLAELEARQKELQREVTSSRSPRVALHPNLAQQYRAPVAQLRTALARDDGVSALEAARCLIEKVLIYPPDDDGGPPKIELVGNLLAMLKAGLDANSDGYQLSSDDDALASLVSSIKEAPRAEPPP